MLRLSRVLLLATLLSTPALAEDGLTIESFSALTGYWVGTGFGGHSEEIWMPPVDGRLSGIFKQSMDGELQFSEYMEISQVDGEFVLRLKHFNPDFTGWEEKNDFVTFRFESLTQESINFRGLSYMFPEPGKLRVSLNLRDSDGNLSTEYFDFERRELD